MPCTDGDGGMSPRTSGRRSHGNCLLCRQIHVNGPLGMLLLIRPPGGDEGRGTTKKDVTLRGRGHTGGHVEGVGPFACDALCCRGSKGCVGKVAGEGAGRDDGGG